MPRTAKMGWGPMGTGELCSNKNVQMPQEERTNEMVWVLWVLPVWLLAPRGQDSLTPFPSTACVDPFLLFTTEILADLHPSCGYQGASQANPS